jgi:hypothetical protein
MLIRPFAAGNIEILAVNVKRLREKAAWCRNYMSMKMT